MHFSPYTFGSTQAKNRRAGRALRGPSGAPFLGAPRSPVALTPKILLPTPQLFLLGGNPWQPDSCLWQLLA